MALPLPSSSATSAPRGIKNSPAFAAHPPLSRLTGALLLALAGSGAWAQTTHSETQLKAVTISERTAAPQADVSGWGDVPLKELPLSATVISHEQLQALGARRLADVTALDASVTDAYNSPGYWDFVAVRGFVLDNRFNYQREGLPISAETTIPLDNKERIEILKGTSGIQAGTSAPGGLVNYVVKRPTEQDLRSVQLEVSGRGGLLTALDLGGRFGVDKALGYRLNVAHEELKPRTFNLDGSRDLVALAADWRINRDSVLEAEVEWSHKSQPSQAGFSLLGNTLPAPVDPRLNLNNQKWSQPSEFDALTGSIRFEQALNSDWRWSVQAGRQELKSNDRLAYASGCGTEFNYDRYCSNGSYDMYDFRSENERRMQEALKLALKGQVRAAGLTHDVGLGVQTSRVRQRFQTAVYKGVGSGLVDGSVQNPTNATPDYKNTNRNERAVELSLHDAIRWTEQFTTWIGLRHTRLNRDSIRTDNTEYSTYSQDLTTPWLALSYKFSPAQTLYASYGEGAESQVVPNRITFSNAGVALPALKSRQWELGVKGTAQALDWQVALFRIARPVSNIDGCTRLSIDPCKGGYDGSAVHRGLEANAQWTQGPWRLGGSMTLLDAERQGSSLEPAINGQRPTNVPRMVLRSQVAWQVAQVPGLELQTQLNHEGQRNVVADGSITLPSWTRLDASLRYATKLSGTPTTWTVAVTNLADKRYWQESPTQFGHIYLYPGAARALRMGVEASF